MPPDPSPIQNRDIVVSSEKPLSVDAYSGCILQTINTTRSVKAYAIQEHELYSLDDLGRNSKLWTAIGAALFSFSASCFWSISQSTTTVEAGSKALATVLMAISIVAFGAGAFYGRKRKSRLEKIISECEG